MGSGLDDRSWCSCDNDTVRGFFQANMATELERITNAIIAFAAGDALGVPWEGKHPASIEPARVVEIPAKGRGGWPRGTTSDDTAQMMLLASSLVDNEGESTKEDFLARLAAEEQEIVGLGPTTRAALRNYRNTGVPPSRLDKNAPATNGAAMRTLPVGWMMPVARVDRRRQLAINLAGATHLAPESVGAACIATAMAAWSIEGVSVGRILAAAREEVHWISGWLLPLTALEEVTTALSGDWRSPPDGVTLAASQTVAAVIHVLRTHADLANALPYAVSLGGDTDTVAALVGGILGGMDPGSLTSLTWLGRVNFPQRHRVDRLAAGLVSLRNQVGG
jgi:ADP-ribosyl-[dinitrogen reductase] hydrolase